jgi:hypothetical protein
LRRHLARILDWLSARILNRLLRKEIIIAGTGATAGFLIENLIEFIDFSEFANKANIN